MKWRPLLVRSKYCWDLLYIFKRRLLQTPPPTTHTHTPPCLPPSILLSLTFFVFSPPPFPPRRRLVTPTNKSGSILKKSAAGARPRFNPPSPQIKEETRHILSLGRRLLRLRPSVACAPVSMRKPWRMLAPSEALRVWVSHPPFFFWMPSLCPRCIILFFFVAKQQHPFTRYAVFKTSPSPSVEILAGGRQQRSKQEDWRHEPYSRPQSFSLQSEFQTFFFFFS